MQGRILAFDFRTSEGEIAGNDGNRYAFAGVEWKQSTPPKAGQIIDFQTDGGRALSIYSVSGSTTSSSDKNRIVAALLAFFLGGLGIHKFYLGKSTAGLIMLLCSVFGIILVFIPTIIIGIIAFIEFIIYLMTSDEDFEERYVQGNKAWF
jgi:TM2 domain-containing membrane protein YozV